MFISPILKAESKLDTIIPQDTICITLQKSAKIIDSLLYLKQYQQYSIICDKTVLEQKFQIEDLKSATSILIDKNNITQNQFDRCSLELMAEKNISKSWQNLAAEKDLEIQKIKAKNRKTIKFLAITGSIVIACLTSGIIMAKIL